MLSLNKKTDYGLIALTCLAAHPDELFSARRIAQRYQMRSPLLKSVAMAIHRSLCWS